MTPLTYKLQYAISCAIFGVILPEIIGRIFKLSSFDRLPPRYRVAGKNKNDNRRQLRDGYLRIVTYVSRDLCILYTYPISANVHLFART